MYELINSFLCFVRTKTTAPYKTEEIALLEIHAACCFPERQSLKKTTYVFNVIATFARAGGGGGGGWEGEEGVVSSRALRYIH